MRRITNEVYGVEELPNRIIKVIALDNAEYLNRGDEIVVIFNNMHVPIGKLEYVEEHDLYIKVPSIVDMCIDEYDHIMYCKFYKK